MPRHPTTAADAPPARARRRALIAAAVAVLALPVLACLPIPHTQREAPAFAGVVLRDGVPAAGVEVVLAVNARGNACSAGRARALTDAQGRFALPETTYFTPALLFGDRRDYWALCFRFPGAMRAQWTGSAWWGGPARQALRCNVAGPPSAEGVLVLTSVGALDDASSGCVVETPGAERR